MKTKGLGRGVKHFLKKHGADILLGLGVIGMGVAAVDAVRKTPEAQECIEAKKDELGVDKLTPVSTVQATWPCYVRPVLTFASSVGCVVGSRHMYAKQNAVLAAACALSETSLKEYTEKTKEILGEKKESEIRDAIAEDRMRNDPLGSKEVIATCKGDSLCYDSLTGRYFRSNIDEVKRAVEKVNYRLLQEMYISLNDFYYEVGLPDTNIGGSLGWNVTDGYLEPYFSSHLAEDGTPCLSIAFNRPPIYGYDSY